MSLKKFHFSLGHIELPDTSWTIPGRREYKWSINILGEYVKYIWLLVFLISCIIFFIRVDFSPLFILQSDTEVWVVWALHTSAEANAGLSKHTTTGVFPDKHNLIKEAGGTGPTTRPPTEPTAAASEMGPCAVAFAILSLMIAYVLSL